MKFVDQFSETLEHVAKCILTQENTVVHQKKPTGAQAL